MSEYARAKNLLLGRRIEGLRSKKAEYGGHKVLDSIFVEGGIVVHPFGYDTDTSIEAHLLVTKRSGKHPRPKSDRLTKKQLASLNQVFCMAVENSCSCECNGRGYIGHDYDCWVHMERRHLKVMEQLLESYK